MERDLSIGEWAYMRYHRILGIVGLVICLILTGCNQKETVSDTVYPLPERLDELSFFVPVYERRAELFAADLCVVSSDVPGQDSSIKAEAAAVFSLDDPSTLFAKNAFKRLYPASITKVMTALVAIRHGNLPEAQNMQEKVTVGQETIITEPGATLCHISPGDTLTMEQLLYGLMLPSGNDAGAAIAVHISGNIQDFADLMNQEAKAIGATDTHFVNPHGLHDEQHYTTAYDLYLIFQEAMKEPAFRQVVGTSSYTAEFLDAQGNAKSQSWNNSNQYLTGQQPMPSGLSILGGKTGTTRAAGSCLIMESQDEQGHEYVSVVMKSENRQTLYQDMTNIIQKIVN